MTPDQVAAHRPGARITGLGEYRPRTVVTNDDVAAQAAITAEWIESRTGIRSRRRADADETMAMMASSAADLALADAGVAPIDVGLVILASTTPRRPVPGAAPEVAHRLGCLDAGAFDLNAACAGFTYGVNIAAEAVRSGSARHVVIIGADRFGSWISPEVPDTFAIFGDGAGAAVVSRSEQDGIWPCVWGCDGAKSSLIRIPDDAHELRMAGPLVYKWAVDTLPGIARSACKTAGMTMEEIDWLVMHQANSRMIDTVAGELGLPRERVAYDIAQSGNTSSASIPLALTSLRRQGHARNGEHVLLLGFGAGLTYVSLVARMM
jgi:3-oxoacyl-[acyl-carrier-protein] synthase III